MTALRPLTLADVDLLEPEGASEEARGKWQWFGYPTVRRMRASVLEERTVTGEGGRLAAIDDTGDLVGDVTWSAASWGGPESRCWRLGIHVLLARRCEGHGSAAQRLMADYLFAHTRAERVEAVTDVGNVGEQRALAHAGFTLEGVVRRGQWRGGGWHDQQLWSRLRGE